MEASKVIPPHYDDGVQSKNQYAPIIIQCVNALVDKENILNLVLSMTR